MSYLSDGSARCSAGKVFSLIPCKLSLVQDLAEYVQNTQSTNNHFMCFFVVFILFIYF